jgi:hypothetical protein
MIRLLAPSPFSFTNLGIEIAIIAVPAKAVNRKARRGAARRSQIVQQALRSGLISHTIIVPLRRMRATSAQASPVRHQVRIRILWKIPEPARRWCGAFASSVIRCTPGDRQISSCGIHKHARETTMFCRNFSIFPMSRNTDIRHIPARIVANSRHVCLCFLVSWQHMAAFSVFLPNTD